MLASLLLAASLSGAGWEFSKDATNWTAVTVPHDWAIAGPFDPKMSGWQGKLPWKGEGRYRRHFDLTKAERARLADGGRAYLDFDGVMASPRVRLNGTDVGGWDYGYMSFTLDVTAAVKETDNFLEVACTTKDHASRWYPGAGIYRNVRLRVLPKDHVVPGTLKITTEVDGMAKVRVEYVSSVNGPERQEFTVENPRLWSLDDPFLYTLTLKGERFRYGIRTFEFTADDGFHLNGRRVQLKGVNLHSDMGPLGMAFDRDVMKRQLLIMKDMGFNALRTSHNAPDPHVLDLCDEMGIFVWDECFDKWEGTSGRPKGENLEGYVEKNLKAFVRRDRNHPCVFAWSIGNEIWAYHEKDEGGRTGTTRERFARFRDAVRSEDATRPVGIGCCFEQDVKIDGLFEPLDLTGWNYGEKYKYVKEKYPQKPVLYTESASALSEYGFYERPPATEKTGYSRDTLQVGSYDHCAAPWSDIPDHEFARMERDTYCGGEFVWTGIDYLGEPTPIANGKEFGIQTNNELLARSSYFGIVDLCGVPKDRFYLYRSHWNPEAKTIHILPHWNWNSQLSTLNSQLSLPVYVYTSGDSAELFLNGRSLGLKRKGAKPEPVAGCTNDYYDVCARYRLRWFDVPYEPGELKVVAYRGGKVLGEETVRTAGKPVEVKLTDDPYNPAGARTRFVQVDLVDAKGTRDPLSMARVSFRLEGPGEIAAVGNGNPKGYDSFKDTSSHPLFYGKAVAVVRRTGSGKLTLRASVPGLKDGVLEIRDTSEVETHENEFVVTQTNIKGDRLFERRIKAE